MEKNVSGIKKNDVLKLKIVSGNTEKNLSVVVEENTFRMPVTDAGELLAVHVIKTKENEYLPSMSLIYDFDDVLEVE